MLPSTQPTCSLKALWKLGLFVLVVLLPLLLLSCASTKQLAQELQENHGTFLTPLPAATVSRPAVKSVASPAAHPADKPAAKPTKESAPLKVCSVVSEDDLQDMRGCLGVYYFDYNFDINLTATPQVSVNQSFQAVLPDGSAAPTVNTTSAVFRDNNVSYTAGILGSEMGSSLVVAGSGNVVFANTQFNFHMPSASVLIPSISVMPAASLSGIGR
jgi:hypothetical protein